ncbi:MULTISPECIES: AsmA-like C-terminal region-containing protein [unclassified Polaribacter]|uniref:AsmA-like C-terminal region-containing protein n=1 Tax=unclassified Polaribacter TaxID=196858 RepID=UPI0011BE8BEF|nr:MULTISPECIES: AsmA-like C-terminal region-containing protein [unclassified Polaribacter]TXD51299.1 AsmA family protein [Polaribacter sp. IC063]TXD56588.1 AsmA family protein [Polaribacter sp. IC066]
MKTEKKRKSLGKKVTTWVLSILLILVIGLVSIPFLFKDKIVLMVSNTMNNNINASVTFKEVDVSLFKNFPLASITIADIAVLNKAPFLGDTLYSAKTLNFSMNITELLKKADEVIALKSINTKNGQVNIIFNKENMGNYDIAIAKETPKNTQTTNTSFSFDIQEYALNNMTFRYIDQSSMIEMKLENINHTGKGNFAEDILDLDTKSKANLSLDLDKVNYINNAAISLDAILGIDLKNSIYTFKENKGIINQLPLAFDGFIQLVDENQLYDLTFKTPTSSFKNLLALLPKQYSGNLETIKTEGNFDLKGTVKGVLSATTIPAFDIYFSSKNALFKYDDLPKAVKNINIDARIVNKTGITKDTYVNVDKLNFKIDEDVFSANGNIANLTSNPKVNLTAKGIINLANIGQVYPALLKNELAGILNADVTTNFDMNSIENGKYQNVKNSGTIKVTDFKYAGDDVANTFYISKTAISFNSNTIKLNEFDAKTGSSDIAINGNLDNFYGLIFKDEVLKGNFNLKSNTFKISDFLTEEPKAEEATTTAALKIPAFLDCKFNAEAKKVVYDNINLTNVSGTIYVKDETVNLQNLKSDIFGGKIGFDGNVSTKGNASTFKMNLKLDELNIAESFSNLEMLKAIAPIAKTIEGKINSTLQVSGNLNEDMTPNLKTISGELFGKLLNPKLKASNSKALSLLSNKVPFLDADQLNLDGINALLSFENGQVNVKPIPLKYKDIGMVLSGNHSFDNKMDYDIVFDVPVKYLGAEVTTLISKLATKDATDVKSVPVKATLSGSFTNPNFATNIKDATSNLVKELVERQKQSLISKGKDKIADLLGLGANPQDSTKTTPKDKAADKIKDVLGGLFGKKKKDTVKGNK